MNKPIDAVSALLMTACAVPERKTGRAQPLPDGGQITYLRIAIIGCPTQLQAVKLCRPHGVPQMAIGPGCARTIGGVHQIYVMRVPSDGSLIVNHYDILAQWDASSGT